MGWYCLRNGFIVDSILVDANVGYVNEVNSNTNISAAEQALTKNKTALDATLKETKLEIFNEQETLDLYSDLLDTKEWAPVLAAIIKAAAWDEQARKDVEAFHNEYLKKKAEGQFNRADQLAEKNIKMYLEKASSCRRF